MLNKLFGLHYVDTSIHYVVLTIKQRREYIVTDVVGGLYVYKVMYSASLQTYVVSSNILHIVVWLNTAILTQIKIGIDL